MQKIINLDFYIIHKKELKINQRNDTNVTTNQKQTHRLREGNYDSQREGWWEGRVRKFGMDTYSLLYLKWVTRKKPTVGQGPLLDVMRQPGWEGI